MTDVLDNRKTAHYPGDTTDTIGQAVGPTLAGEYLIVDQADYDPLTNITTCRFRYATQDDADRLAAAHVPVPQKLSR